MQEANITKLIEDIANTDDCCVCGYGGFWSKEKDVKGKYILAEDHRKAIREIIMKVLDAVENEERLEQYDFRLDSL